VPFDGVTSISLVEEITMSRLRVLCFSLSIDGFAAGPEQSLENPNGVGGLAAGAPRRLSVGHARR